VKPAFGPTEPGPRAPGGPKTGFFNRDPHISWSRGLTQIFVPIRCRLLGFSKIMIPQKFNVCSCHFTFYTKCIYRGGVGVEQPMPGQGRPAPKLGKVTENKGLPSPMHEQNSPNEQFYPRTKAPSRPRCLVNTPSDLVSRTPAP
jgi:hypothetical protein